MANKYALAEHEGFLLGKSADLDSPENGYLEVGKTATKLAEEYGWKGRLGNLFARGYITAIGQAVRID